MVLIMEKITPPMSAKRALAALDSPPADNAALAKRIPAKTAGKEIVKIGKSNPLCYVSQKAVAALCKSWSVRIIMGCTSR
jgi:hypothetical protein